MLTMDADEARKQTAIKLELATRLGDDFEVDNLYSGDFAALDTPLSLGVERKKFSNLVQSMGSGELDEQMTRLVNTYDVPVLLVEGLPVPDPAGGVHVWGAQHTVPYAWVVGAVAGWFGRGAMFFHVTDKAATPATLIALYHMFAKKEHRQVYAPKRVLPALRRMSLVEAIMIQFPGVGPKRAEGLAAIPLVELAGWSREDWVTRLGKITGGRVYEAWRGGNSGSSGNTVANPS